MKNINYILMHPSFSQTTLRPIGRPLAIQHYTLRLMDKEKKSSVVRTIKHKFLKDHTIPANHF